MASQSIGQICRLMSQAQRDSRSGTVYLVISGPVRGATAVYVRDRATHAAVRTTSEVTLAVAELGRIDFTGLDTLTGV